MENKRNLNLDILRGIAVVQMIIFHFTYDLDMLKFTKVNFNIGFWYWFPRIIVFFFLYTMGITLTKVHGQQFYPDKMWSRFKKIAFFAIGVSVVTYIMFPKNWVYFGTLHCIAVATLIGAPLARYPRVNLFISILIIISIYVFDITYAKLSVIVSISSIDYIPIYPWYFVVGFGIFVGHLKWDIPQLPANFLTKFLANLGKKSLIIYILHQPIMFGSLYLIYILKNR